jgi:hypothetical protein
MADSDSATLTSEGFICRLERIWTDCIVISDELDKELLLLTLFLLLY